MNEIVTKTVSHVLVRAIATDGGTMYVEAEIDVEDGFFFYVDGRIESETPGEIYTEYPDMDHSEMIPSCSDLAVSIKRLLSKAIRNFQQ